MFMKNRLVWSAGSAAALLALTACGGGGDDAAPGDAGGGAQVSINADNYVSVGVSALDTMGLASTGAMATGANVENRRVAALTAFTQSQLQRAVESQSSAPPTATGAVSSVSQACAAGGSLSYTYNLGGAQGTLNAGDTIQSTFNNCRQDGETWNGTMEMVVERASGQLSSSVYDLQYRVTYRNLSARMPNSSFVTNGSIGLAVKSVGPHNVATEIVTKSLSTAVSYAGSTLAYSISDYDLRVAQVPSGASYMDTVAFNSTFTISSLGSQTLRVSTPVPWVSYGDAPPSSGQIVIASSTGAKVRLTARSGDVLFELDANGDGVYEARRTVSWNEL